MKPVVLVGLMGSGKSTVGALVAQRTGRAFVDVDVVIAARTGKTVRELWEEGGEAAYRHLESEAVLRGPARRDAVPCWPPPEASCSIPWCAPPSPTASSSGCGPARRRWRAGSAPAITGRSSGTARPRRCAVMADDAGRPLPARWPTTIIDTDGRDAGQRSPTTWSDVLAGDAWQTPDRRNEGDTMLRPQDTRDARDQAARRHLELRRRPGRGRARPRAGGAPRCPRPGACRSRAASTTSWWTRALHDHVGDVWYQRTVFIPRGWAGQRIVLRFDAATHRATVWVEDTLVAEHEGGYTPFEADVSALVSPGEECRLTVVVNNELTWQSIPPGVVEVLPDGTRRQRQYHDFFNYAGLHRSVWLYTTPRVAHRRPHRR